MTDQIDQIDSDDVDNTEEKNTGRGRRMFITGAGIAGAAALVGKAGNAEAANGDNVVAGQNVDSTAVTTVTNNGTSTDRSNNAIKGVISNAGNNSHTILGTTVGDGHAIAGVVGTPDGPQPENPVAATWGRTYAAAAATEGQSLTEDIPVAGPANAVKGIIESPTNGSHSVLGLTAGGGHAIAGVIGSADEDGNITVQEETVAATWGRHYGNAAATEGQSLAQGVDIAGPANGVKGIVESPSNGSHAVLGITNGGGHSIAGDTPADAAGPNGEGPNTTAATWGRHGGLGAGIGGVNTGNGYGGEFIGGKSHIRLIQEENGELVGPPSGDDHALGEMYADGVGGLWYNTAAGSNWVMLNAGSNILFTDPQRAFDSRRNYEPAGSPKARIGAQETIEIDLTQFTDYLPSYQGALLNVTVDAPADFVGYATVFNGDTADGDRPNTSSINWGADTEVVANSVTARTSTRGTIKVFARREIDLIIDVIGYIT